MLRKKEGSIDVAIFINLAFSNLKIDQHSLREWKDTKQKILRIKKDVKRQRGES
jgi:hypothetical protein